MEFEKFKLELEAIKKTQKKEISEGATDYNLLTSVLSPHDEVRLHSGILHSLFNPDGKHYRGILFLELFLKSIKKDGFFKDLSEVTVTKEDNYMDIYLTDGEKHIIIENKINAGYQEKQIERYIDYVKKNKHILPPEDILVIYLSVNRKIPTSHSLGSLQLNENLNFLMSGDNKVAAYKAVHYEKEILEWLDACIKSTERNINLYISLQQYESVVQEISGFSYSNLTSYEKLFKKGFEYMDYFCQCSKNENKCKSEIGHDYDMLEKAYKRIANAKFKGFLEIFCQRLLAEDKTLSLGEFGIFMDEMYFSLDYKEMSFRIYLKPKRSISSDNFFNFKSLALFPTEDWSAGNQGTDRLVGKLRENFNTYLRDQDLEKYIVGTKKGEAIQTLDTAISFKDIYSCTKESTDITDRYDFQEVKNHIKIIKKNLKY